MARQIKNITSQTFGRYGFIIEHDGAGEENFQVVLSEQGAVGWRIAVNRIENKTVGKLARHPSSMESFEPVAGVTLLCVAEPDSPQDCEVFLLDRPVCLRKNTWHATMCLSAYSIVKICENAEVGSEDHELERDLQVQVV